MIDRILAIRRGPIFELVFVVAVAIGLALAVQAYAVKPYRIPSGSMQPTLDIGQRVLVNRFSTRLGADPEPGDIVVFHPPENAVDGRLPKCGAADGVQLDGQVCPEHGPAAAGETFIKRVVAGPGDRLKVVDGIPVVNDVPLEGDWRIVPCADCDFPSEITVPDDEYFMMGDNRPGSDDSRFWGPVPRDWIVGEALLSYWPPDRVGSL